MAKLGAAAFATATALQAPIITNGPAILRVCLVTTLKPGFEARDNATICCDLLSDRCNSPILVSSLQLAAAF